MSLPDPRPFARRVVAADGKPRGLRHPANWVHRTARHIGRRGAFLITFGVIFALIGANLAEGVPKGTRDSYALALDLAPLDVYGAAWILCGLTAITAAVLRDKWHWIGFAALTAISTLWTVVWLAAWLHGDADRGYQGAIIYASLALASQLVAGLVDPLRVRGLVKDES